MGSILAGVGGEILAKAFAQGAGRRAAGFAASVLIAFSAQPAAADYCQELRTQLAAATHPVGSNARSGQYAEAARRQAAELRKVEQAQRSHRCQFAASPQCRTLARTLQDMRANLAELEWMRDRAGPRRDQSRIQALEARLHAYGCDRQQRFVRVAPPTPLTSNGRRSILPEGTPAARNDVRRGFGQRAIAPPPAPATSSSSSCIFNLSNWTRLFLRWYAFRHARRCA